MEREIKFRGIQTYGKKLVYGYLVKFGFENRIYYGSKENEFAVVDGSTVGQYTGLKDKNGKEIYEGDIISSKQWNPETFQVGFDRGGFCFYNEGDSYYNDAKYLEDFEVTGNIHEKAV